MGMCKECGEVFSAFEMTNGICKNCATAENITEAKMEIDKAKKEDENKLNSLGFQWWNIWAWLNLTIGNLYILGYLYLYTMGVPSNFAIVGIVFLVINTALMIMILKYNKYAFLIATIFSSPLLWIINGIYLKNRWNHPKLNSRG